MSEFDHNNQQPKNIKNDSNFNPSLSKFQDNFDSTIDELIESIEAPELSEEEYRLIENVKQENEQLKAKIKQLETIKASNINSDTALENQQLVNQLRASSQTIQHQQVMIKTLSNQLRETQEQIAHLERECSQIQDDYNQQTYKLLETEKQLQELHSRLLRQQRYTLEYKTTLEACFENATNQVIAANNSLSDSLSELGKTSQEINPSTPRFSSKQPLVNIEEDELVSNTKIKNAKINWPSPAIERKSTSGHQKMKRNVELPNFLK